MSLLKSDHVYKPFKYPWAYEAWLTAAYSLVARRGTIGR